MCIRRTLVAILLSALLTATASSQSKDAPKWPDKIEGKNLQEWLKIAVTTTDSDPAVRERALLTIASFDPVEIRKVAAKTLIGRMVPGREPDAGVRLAVIKLVGDLGIDNPEDVTNATRTLAQSATAGTSVLRLTAIQALGKFGPKAYGHINELTTSVVLEDSSYVIRQSLAHTLGRIGSSETTGPSAQALKVLAGTLAHDKSAVVQLEALQSLFILGPPWIGAIKPGAKELPPIDQKAAQDTINGMKTRIGAKKTTITDSDKQVELWCRLVIIKFGLKEDLDEQLPGIAAHLSDPEPAVKIQALGILSILGENAAPQMGAVVKLLEGGGLAESASVLRTKQAVRAAALRTLGAIGVKAIDPIVKTIDNPKEYPEIRFAALDALAILGEKAEPARELLKTIITDPANLKGEGITLLAHALSTLASMGVKALPAIPELMNLMVRLDKVRDERVNGADYIKIRNSQDLRTFLERLPPDERKTVSEKLFENPEDQFKKLVEETIKFIKESTPGHPGGEHKKP